MQSYIDFYTHLGHFPDKGERQNINLKYKNPIENFCFEMNGVLRLGLDTTNVQLSIDSLSKIFCARNKLQIKLFRMTSDVELTPNICCVQTGNNFRYQAFLSTALSENPLSGFVPNSGTPTIL